MSQAGRFVTGASGFIGRELVAKLGERGDNVLMIARSGDGQCRYASARVVRAAAESPVLFRRDVIRPAQHTRVAEHPLGRRGAHRDDVGIEYHVGADGRDRDLVAQMAAKQHHLFHCRELLPNACHRVSSVHNSTSRTPSSNLRYFRSPRHLRGHDWGMSSRSLLHAR